jgi:hypothetical protein
MRALIAVDVPSTALATPIALLALSACLAAVLTLCVKASRHNLRKRRLPSNQEGAGETSVHEENPGNRASSLFTSSHGDRVSSHSVSKGASSLSQICTKSDSAAIFTLPSTCVSLVPSKCLTLD